MQRSDIRKPAVAGQFYPAVPAQLRSQIEGFVDPEARKENALGLMLPHAGYVYSGKVAAVTASQAAIKGTVVMLGPNHTGYGTALSVMARGLWETPFGRVPINEKICAELLGQHNGLRDDELAHQYEHSLEVELPILQYFRTDFSIVPIAIATDDVGLLKEVGAAVAAVIARQPDKEDFLVLASSDMTHYETQDQAHRKDKQALEAVTALDEDGLIKKVRGLDISMCGYAPVIVMLAAVKALGARRARVVAYETSGDITGDLSSVVGYAGVIVS